MPYNVNNWYWKVADHASSGVFSSASLTYVLTSDGTYINWVAAGNSATDIPNEEQLWGVIQSMASPPPAWLFDGTTFSESSPGTYTTTQLLAYAAQVRFNIETGGLAISTNLTVSTDLQSQSMITGAYNYVTANPGATLNWKTLDSTFVILTADEIIEIADAVGAFVQACFTAEAAVAVGIGNATITTPAQIDAVFAAI